MITTMAAFAPRIGVRKLDFHRAPLSRLYSIQTELLTPALSSLGGEEREKKQRVRSGVTVQ